GPLAAALPEPVPVPAAGEEDTSPEEERSPERQPDSEHTESRYGEPAERHEGEATPPSEPGQDFHAAVTDPAPPADWNAPLPPAEPTPEHSEGSEHYQEPEPTLAAWQEDWQPPPTGPAQPETASHDGHRATGWRAEARGDGVG